MEINTPFCEVPANKFVPEIARHILSKLEKPLYTKFQDAPLLVELYILPDEAAKIFVPEIAKEQIFPPAGPLVFCHCEKQ